MGLNTVSLMGRMAADPNYRVTPGQDGKEVSMALYRLAVERDYKEGSKRPADFISCKAFGSNARYAKEYLHKGDLVAVKGRIFSEAYERQGEKIYCTGILVEKSYMARQKMQSAQDAMGEHMPVSMEKEDFPFLPDDFDWQ